MKKKLEKHITSRAWYQRFENWLHQFHVGRKSQISAYFFLQVFFKNIVNNTIQIRASSVAFSLTLSLFPFLLFLITLIPYTPLEYGQVISFMKEHLPRDIFSVLEETINDIMLNKRTDLLSLSFILALYAATNGMAALISAFNSAFVYARKRTFIQQRLVALWLTLIVSFIFLFSVIALIISRFTINSLADLGFLNDKWIFIGIVVLKYIIVLMVFFVAISMIYYIAPASHERWNFFSLGSVFTSIATILVTNLFSYYLENFASYNKLYGSIGTFIALMLWIYLLAFLLILGFEVNSSWMEARKTVPKQGSKVLGED